jgi:hypothetical protein
MSSPTIWRVLVRVPGPGRRPSCGRARGRTRGCPDEPSRGARRPGVAARASVWLRDTVSAAEDLAALEALGVHGPFVTLQRTAMAAGIAALEGRIEGARALFVEARRGMAERGIVVEVALLAIDVATTLGPADPDVQAVAAQARQILGRLGAGPFLARLDAALADARPMGERRDETMELVCPLVPRWDLRDPSRARRSRGCGLLHGRRRVSCGMRAAAPNGGPRHVSSGGISKGVRTMRPDMPPAMKRSFADEVLPLVETLDAEVAQLVHGYNAGDAEATFAALGRAGDVAAGLVATLRSSLPGELPGPLRATVAHLVAAGMAWTRARSTVARHRGEVALAERHPLPAGASPTPWEAILWEEVLRADGVWAGVAAELAAIAASGPAT